MANLSPTSSRKGSSIVHKADALLFIPGYYVLGRSDLDINPVRPDQVKNGQWDSRKIFSPIYGDTTDIMQDVVYPKVEQMISDLWKSNRVLIQLLEYHGIRDSRIESERQATPYLMAHLEKNKYRGNPVVGFITKTIREILIESELPTVHCLVMENERWDMVSDDTRNTNDDSDDNDDNDDETIEKSVPYLATGPGFHVLGAQPDHSLLRIERNLTLTLGSPIGPAYKKMKKSNRIWEGTVGLYLSNGTDVIVVTASHVLPGPKSDEEYVYRDKSAPQRVIQMPADVTYKRMVEKTSDLITQMTLTINILELRAQRTEATGRLKRDLENAQETLQNAIKFRDEKLCKWGPEMEKRITGHISYSSGLVPSGTKEDILIDVAVALLDLKKAKVYPQNSFYVGLQHHFSKLLRWFQLGKASNPVPKLDNGNSIRLKEGQYASMKDIRRPAYTNAQDDSSYPIIKTGRTTDDTVGRLNGTMAQRSLIVNGEMVYMTEIIGFEAMEGQGGYFSQPGDSGAACVDAQNRLVGWVTGGSGLNHRTDKTYIYPAWHFFEVMLPHIIRTKALPGSPKWTMTLPVGKVPQIL
ncbi:MAG: hypothetical protein M1825_002722 [Sarcosagium campestre]|nr:MAG: hypothetical protein M1825_002722 [Sarcosagium campestre]